jgi:membrane-associated phospholipid phosphatase
MVDREAEDAWRLYRFNWMPLLLIGQLLVLGLALTDFSLKIEGLFLQVAGMVALLAVAAAALSHKGYMRLAFVAGSISQLELLFLLATPLTYIAASIDLPMQDSNLAFVDRLLGLDWKGYYDFVCGHPSLVTYVYLGYAMIVWPTFGVPIILGLTGNYRRLQRFTLACMLTVAATACISSLVPAVGTYHEYGVSPDTPLFKASGYLVQLHELPLVRGGSLHVLNFETLGGIITFPSFHAAAAVLAMWALWGVWWMRPLAAIAFIGMLLATPLAGGHYFIDVFAGAGLAVIAIVASGLVADRSSAAVSVMTRSPVTA